MFPRILCLVLLLISFIIFIIPSVLTISVDCDYSKYATGCDEKTNNQCHLNTSICICKPDYPIRLEDGVCLDLKSIGEECKTNEQCSHEKNSICGVDQPNPSFNYLLDFRKRFNKKSSLSPKRCRCEKGHQVNLINNKCIYKFVGSQCSTHQECQSLVANSQCLSRTCDCDPNHFYSNGSCVSKRSFDQNCSKKLECQSNMVCHLEKCKCRPNYLFNALMNECQAKSNENGQEKTVTIWDSMVKAGGFIMILLLLAFLLCTRKESEEMSGVHGKRQSSNVSRLRSSSNGSHRPLTQTSSNASNRSSMYRTFEEQSSGKEIQHHIVRSIIIPTPNELVRSLSSSDDEAEYNPYQFDALFPQRSVEENPPTYDQATNKKSDHH